MDRRFFMTRAKGKECSSYFKVTDPLARKEFSHQDCLGSWNVLDMAAISPSETLAPKTLKIQRKAQHFKMNGLQRGTDTNDDLIEQLQSRRRRAGRTDRFGTNGLNEVINCTMCLLFTNLGRSRRLTHFESLKSI